VNLHEAATFAGDVARDLSRALLPWAEVLNAFIKRTLLWSFSCAWCACSNLFAHTYVAVLAICLLLARLPSVSGARVSVLFLLSACALHALIGSLPPLAFCQVALASCAVACTIHACSQLVLAPWSCNFFRAVFHPHTLKTTAGAVGGARVARPRRQLGCTQALALPSNTEPAPDTDSCVKPPLTGRSDRRSATVTATSRQSRSLARFAPLQRRESRKRTPARSAADSVVAPLTAAAAAPPAGRARPRTFQETPNRSLVDSSPSPTHSPHPSPLSQPSPSAGRRHSSQTPRTCANKWWEVECLVDVRTSKTTSELEYRVRWKGYADDADEWKSAGQLVDEGCADSIDDFHKRFGQGWKKTQPVIPCKHKRRA
jgi:hypothetical protein